MPFTPLSQVPLPHGTTRHAPLGRETPSTTGELLPLVSILITNYNCAAFLRACVDSVLQQNYPHKQIILVDDGSSDGSRQVIESYGTQLQAIFKENGGQTSAFNAGVGHCRGDILICLDADDYLYPGSLAVYASVMRDQGVVKAQGVLDVIQSDGTLTGGKMPGHPAEDGDLREKVLEFGPGSYICPPTSGNAWRQSVISELAPLPEEPTMKGGLDAYLMDTTPLFGRVVNVNRVVGAYRTSETSFTAQNTPLTAKNVRNQVIAYNSLAKFLKRVATAQGHKVSVTGWQKQNWRFLALTCLLHKYDAQEPAPTLRECLSFPFSARKRGNGKNSTIALTLGLLRVLPLRPTRLLASRIFNVRL